MDSISKDNLHNLDDSQMMLIKEDNISTTTNEGESLSLISEDPLNDKRLINKSIQENVQNLEISWRTEALQGNFMPAAVKLDRKEINSEEIVDKITENRLIHLAVNFSFLNVTRSLLELFNCDLNSRNAAGQTALHLVCNNPSKDAYLLSYIMKQENLNYDACDKSGLTALFYAVMNNFNIAIMGLAHLKSNLSHVDNFGNNALYFAINCDNKFALKFLLRHLPGCDINQTYYNKSASLADILITNRNKSCSKYLIKHMHNELNLSSIQACQRGLERFNVYNKFNYDLLNTLYFYKTRDYKGFLMALIGKENQNVNNQTRQFVYTYKLYNLYVFLYDLVIGNTGKITKMFIMWLYAAILSWMFLSYFFYTIENQNSHTLADLISMKTIWNAWQISSVITLVVCLVKFSYYHYKDDFYHKEQYVLNNPEYSSDTVCRHIYEAMERNPIDLIFEEEICEICLIKKDKDRNHCHSCNKCVKDFYFHSKFFNICFSRSNISYYILLLSSLCALHFSIVALIFSLTDIDSNSKIGQNSKTIYVSQYYTTNFIIFLINAGLIRILFSLLMFVSGVLLLQKSFCLILCYGYKTTYYNMFRMHKRSVGIIQARGNLYYNVPQMNLISLWEFIKNLFK
jgi:hypothetical protein